MRIPKSDLVIETYHLWYRLMLADAGKDGKILEIGSGAGFIKQLNEKVITSDIMPGHNMVIDARVLPFKRDELQAIVASHVFHHIPNPYSFFGEAERCIKNGGVISLIEVAHTPLARFLFKNFHHEPYDDKRLTWIMLPKWNTETSNQAQSWIMFVRDRKQFEQAFPFKVEAIELLPWFAYLIGGGVTRKQRCPRFLEPLIFWLDKKLTWLNPLCALHWHIRLRKV